MIRSTNTLPRPLNRITDPAEYQQAHHQVLAALVAVAAAEPQRPASDNIDPAEFPEPEWASPRECDLAADREWERGQRQAENVRRWAS